MTRQAIPHAHPSLASLIVTGAVRDREVTVSVDLSFGFALAEASLYHRRSVGDLFSPEALTLGVLQLQLVTTVQELVTALGA